MDKRTKIKKIKDNNRTSKKKRPKKEARQSEARVSSWRKESDMMDKVGELLSKKSFVPLSLDDHQIVFSRIVLQLLLHIDSSSVFDLIHSRLELHEKAQL